MNTNNTDKPMEWEKKEPLTRGYDPVLCMDDFFPRCDGTRTHPLKLSKLLEIDVVKEYIQATREEITRKLQEFECSGPYECNHETTETHYIVFKSDLDSLTNKSE